MKPQASGCPSSNAGWLWYCEEHDLHGDAKTEEEARSYAEAHVFFTARKRGRHPTQSCASSIVIHDTREDEDFVYAEPSTGDSPA